MILLLDIKELQDDRKFKEVSEMYEEKKESSNSIAHITLTEPITDTSMTEKKEELDTSM